MLVMGLVGYFMRQYQFPGAPMVIGLILGPVVEKSLRQSLTTSHGSFMIFLESPICILFLALTLVSIAWPIIKHIKKNRTKGVS
jgi:putative tricarboxylic transport membrane protein